MCAISLSSQLESPAAVSNRIRDGRAMDGGVSGYSTAASSSGGKKRKGETPRGGGGWYMLYGKFSVYHTSLRAGRAVLQLHPALDLLHCGPVRSSVRVPQRRPEVHWFLLLGLV